LLSLISFYFTPVAADRRANYKKTIDGESNRRNRQETRVQLRKNKKEENLMKRRMAAPSSTAAAVQSNHESDPSSSTKKVATVNDIPQLMAVITTETSTVDQVVEAVRGFRRMLSVERNPPVEEVINSGVLPYLVNFLSKLDSWVLIFESAWALTNIASTNMTGTVVEIGAVPPMIALLKHDMPDIREQAAWCLGNIAGDSRVLRDLLLESDILGPL
jgi:importin subunit alpha-1